MTLSIAFVGMTHLGICSAVAAAEHGANVVCVHFDEDRIRELRSGRLPISEPRLDELFTANRERMQFSSDATVLAQCDLVYIAPDVPTDSEGRSDVRLVESLLEQVDAAVPGETPVVILSQVSPGFSRSHPRRNGQLFYQVETLIFGRAMERALYPERFIVGCIDPDDGKPSALPAPLREFLEGFGCPILCMRYESAELAKISINVCLAASLSAANTLAELCEGVGAEWSEIVPALRLDRRIGGYAYIEAGLGIAGGNIERDLASVIRLSRQAGTSARVIESFVENSHYRRDWALRTLHARSGGRRFARIAVLGIAYKPDTASTKNSPALELARALTPFEISTYDPLVPASALEHARVRPATSALDACSDADALVIMTPWQEFRELKPVDLAQRLRGRLVIDPFGVLDRNLCREAGLDHQLLGSPRATSASRTIDHDVHRGTDRSRAEDHA